MDKVYLEKCNKKFLEQLYNGSYEEIKKSFEDLFIEDEQNKLLESIDFKSIIENMIEKTEKLEEKPYYRKFEKK